MTPTRGEVREGTLERQILDALDPDYGTESFNLPGRGLRSTRAALQRLRAKGLADPAHCPDGAWVWFRVRDATGPASPPAA